MTNQELITLLKETIEDTFSEENNKKHIEEAAEDEDTSDEFKKGVNVGLKVAKDSFLIGLVAIGTLIDIFEGE